MKTATRGPTDRQRRRRIIDATLEVITEVGVSGLSHRRIAKAAGVPLSATTYYFGTLDVLLEEAFMEALERDRERMRELTREQMERLEPGEDEAVAVARVILQVIEDEDSGVLASELCVAALRSEHLRPLSQAWDDGWRGALEPYVGPRRAILVTAFMSGIVMRESISVDRMSAADLEGLARAVLAAETSAPSE